MKIHQRGFTLIELSIVLVIIGLLVGGVVTGRELIKTAESRAILKQIESLNIATRTFKNKYGAIPGDLVGANTKFALLGAGGNGDGLLRDYLGNNPASRASFEPNSFFLNLDSASLISEGLLSGDATGTYNWLDNGATKQYVKIAVGSGGIVATTYDGELFWYLGLNTPFLSGGGMGQLWVISTGGVITPAQAFYVDSKQDDGFPGSGDVFAVTATSGALDTTNGNCVTSSASVYNVSNDTIQCRIYVKAR